MTEPFILPPHMVASNGARLTEDDHPAVPVTISQIVAAARRAADAARIRHAVSLGGKLRVGFENSQFMADGSIAPDNESRGAEAAAMMAAGQT